MVLPGCKLTDGLGGLNPHATVDNPRAHVISGPQGGEVGAAFLAARLRDVCSCLSSITYQKDLPGDLKLQKNR